MPSRQSALSRATAASFKSRSTTAKRSAISSRLGSCSTIRRLASQSRKLMFVSRYEQFRSRENPFEERRAALHLVPKFLHRIHRRVDLAAQSCFGRPERGDDPCERNIPDDQQVNVAPGGLLAARHRTVDEGELDTTLAEERGQTGPQHVHRASGLFDDGLKLGENGGVPVG